jgi:diacylglycerol kinase (ATP)
MAAAMFLKHSKATIDKPGRMRTWLYLHALNPSPVSSFSMITSNKPSATGLRRIMNATRYSIKGLAAAWRGEAAFRQESIGFLALLPVAFWLGETPVQQALLISCLAIVLIVELVNSAIEAAVDRIGDEHHPLAGQAKDMGSAAVFISLLAAGLVWGAIACQRFWF